MYFAALFQSGGQIAGEGRQISNNCSYCGCGASIVIFLSRLHRDGGRKINLMVVTSCQPTSENRIIDLKISAGGTA